MKKGMMAFMAFFFIISRLTAQDATTLLPSAEAAEAPGPVTADTAMQINTALAEPKPLRIIVPRHAGWNEVNEGQTLRFRVQAAGGNSSSFTYHLRPADVNGLQMDSLGWFSWTPGYDVVSRLKGDSTVQFMIEAENKRAERVSQLVNVKVVQVNRPPLIGDLKPFYVRYNTLNTYTIESAVVEDEDEDPLVYVPILDVMPEGAKLSPQGVFSWKPSLTQFNQLREKPLLLEFWVEDQPAKARTKGHFKIEVTQQDLPPSIQMIPAQARYRYKEDATISLRFQLYDPNGESDIASFSMISDNTSVPLNALLRNTPSQYEFIWQPGYDFVKDPLDSLSFKLTFFVIDKSNKQEERQVTFTIENAVNVAEADQKLYDDYRSAMVRAWDLMEQLKDAEEALKKRYRKAKKGKKARSLTNATLGATTGLTPVVIEEPGTSKKVTAIGGTAVMTIGTLEATEVIGRSTKDLVERLNYIMEKRNELQTKGDIFARKWSLKSTRRKADFLREMDDFVAVMNLKGLVALELDAGWKNKAKPTNDNIARTFKDFNGDKE